MSAINFNTSNSTFRQILGNGTTYHVPRFQRDYSWTADQWEDLWQDLEGVLVHGGEPAHYMGYLVLQTKDNKTFDVIDGQQRLTTLSLVVLAVLKGLQDLVDANVDPANNSKRIDQLRTSYVGYLDPVTLIPKSKLTLNRNNDAYYKDYLVPLQKLPQRGLRASEHLLRKAFEWFEKRVRDAYGAKRDGAVLAKFIDDLADKLFFTVINVTDELNAFKVFETLNARGVRLSPTDLLKNYLFSVVHRESSHPTEIETLERRWESMVGSLGGESFPDFLRVHWNSRRDFVREADLFKKIRASTPDKARVFELIRQMEEDLGVYVALSIPEDALWTDEQRPFVRELRTFTVRQPWPLLMAAHRAFDPSGFRDLLRACAVISLRYNVIGGLVTNEQERVYNSVAQKVAKRELTLAGDTIRALAPIYIADKTFSTAFADKVLRTTSGRNKNVALYMLFRLEHHASGTEFDADSRKYSLERILPENPGNNWPEYSDEEADESLYRLGNFALLEADANRGLGNAGFAAKKLAYAKSVFALTRQVATDNNEWTLDRLAERQRWMAKQATAVWRINQLD